MPNLPWEDENVRLNLLTLARLKSGDKLSVLKSGATPSDIQFQNIGKGNRSLRKLFDIQKGGFFKLKQTLERNKKGENILVDQQYLIPLTNIFTRARALFLAGQQGVQLLNTKNAYNGVAMLQLTYQRENDTRRAMKVMTILQALSPLIPKESDRNVIVLKTGFQTLNLFKYTSIWPNLNNTFLQMSNFDTNALARNEQGLGTPPQTQLNVTQAEIQQVILDTPDLFRDTQATVLPTLSLPYTRQALGICQQFPADWLRHPPIVDGVEMGLTWADLRELFVALKHDEGMFFLVSQLCSQVGMEAFPSLLFGHRNAQNLTGGTLEFVFYYNDLYWYPNRASDRKKYLTTTKKAIEIKVETWLRGMYFKSETIEPVQMNLEVTPPFELKVTSVITLQRSGNAITMTLMKMEVEATCN